MCSDTVRTLTAAALLPIQKWQWANMPNKGATGAFVSICLHSVMQAANWPWSSNALARRASGPNGKCW